MVRGRRTRAAAQISSTKKSDEQFASPKRKDCKLETVNTKQKSNTVRPDTMNGASRTRSRAVPITNYFQVKQNDTADNYVSDMDENACDSFDNTNGNNESNIFLQTPVLHLNIDKSPNQASSIIINKSIPIKTNFSAMTNVGLVCFSNIVIGDSINNLSKSHQEQSEDITESESSESSDSNSCDSGVVADRILELSPSKRRKPATPHRIVCPSPAKHAINEKSPTSALSNLNIGTKTNPKSKRRLNVHQTENLTITTIDSDKVTANKPVTQVSNLSNKSTILNSLTDPSAQQNSNNNKITKLTDFFPVRRSVRKTKKTVEQEHERSIEAAICSGQETGLMIKEFSSKGRGIVASKPFTKGEFVVEYIGDLIDMTEANKREQIYAKDENTGCYMYYFKYRNQQYCIDATAESGKLGRLVNHSRNGNLITKTVFYRNKPHLVLIAKENIDEGDELTYDYGDRSKESLLHHPWLAL